MLVKDGKAWCGGHFQMRQNNRLLLFDSVGYWSYPVFILDDHAGVLWLHLVLTARKAEKNYLKLYRPRAMALTPVGSNMLLDYRDFRYREDPFSDMSWDEEIGSYPWKALRELTTAQLKKLDADLLLLSESAAAQFAENNTLPRQYATTYTTLTHPLFFNIVSRLSPLFTNALTNPSQ